jgi:hypothetical protein
MGDRVGIEIASVPIDQPVREMYSWGIFEGVAVLYQYSQYSRRKIADRAASGNRGRTTQ